MEAITFEVQKIVQINLIKRECPECHAHFAHEDNGRSKVCPECANPMPGLKKKRKKSSQKKSHGRPDMPISSIAGKMKCIRKEHLKMFQEPFADFLQSKEKAPMKITGPYIAQFERGVGNKLPEETYKWLVAWVDQEWKKPKYQQENLNL